jgi:hypothetical protein
MSAWNDFVKKIYWEGKKTNPDYQFKDALKDASERKAEMGQSSTTIKAVKGKKNTKKAKRGSRKSRRNRRRGTRRH